MSLLPDFAPLIARHGYLAVGVVVGLESMGVPLPGETLLVAAALYAAATGNLDIGWVVLAASIGAVMGDNAGYLIGRRLGAPALQRFGTRIGLNRRRLLLGQWLFDQHGAPVVFFGRFTALAAHLRGLACRRQPDALVTASFCGTYLAVSAGQPLFGFGAYYLGERILSLAWPVAAVVTLVMAAGSRLVHSWCLRRHEVTLAGSRGAARWRHMAWIKGLADRRVEVALTL